MRELLFRGKRLDNGEWVEGFYLKKQDPLLVGVIYHFIIVQERDNCGCLMSTTTWYKVIPESISEFTGLTDKNGKKVFEGDVVSYRESYFDRDEKLGYVDFGKGCFDVQEVNSKNNPAIDICSEIEVIGNIHDNPELLGGC